MAKVLITIVDAPAPPRRAEAHVPDGEPSGPRWPTLDRARRGEYERVVILAALRFRWEQLIGVVSDAVEHLEPAADEHAHAGEDQEPEAGHDGEHAEGEETHDEAADEGAAATEDGQHQEPAAEAAPAAPEAEPVLQPVTHETASPTEPAAAADPSSAPPADAAAPATGEANATPAPETAPAEKKPRPRQKEHRHPPATEEELIMRLRMMQRTSRIDRAALDKLAELVAQRYGLKEVSCHIAPPLVRERDQITFVRSLVNWPAAGDRVLVDLSDGPRAFAALAVAIAHAFPCLRPEVQVEDVIVERGHGLPVSARHLVAMVHAHELWQGLRDGAAPLELTEHMRREPRLHAVAEPYNRFVRALDFGNPAETSRWARVLDERRDHLRKFGGDGTQHPYVAALSAAIEPFRADAPSSHRQLAMAHNAVKRGNLHLGALHVREALVSGLIEAYGQNPTKGWTTVGGDADRRVRIREVAAWVLSTENAGELVPDLAKLWEWVGNPRTRFLMASPVTIDPNLLRDGATAIEQIPRIAAAVLAEGRFKAIVEALPLERAVQIAVEHDAVRPQPSRGRRGGGRGDDDDEGPDHGDPPEGAEHARPAQAPAQPAPRQDRGRPPREGGDRGPARHENRGPREMTVRPPAPGGPRDGDDARHHSSVPVGGVLKVERAKSGLGNLGFALMNAGLTPTQKPDRNKDQRGGKPREGHPPEKAPEAAEKPVAETPAQPETPAPTPTPDAPAAPPPSFDVAGPVGADPTP